MPVLRKMCAKNSWFWLTPNCVLYLVDIYLDATFVMFSFGWTCSNPITECPCNSNCIASFPNNLVRPHVHTNPSGALYLKPRDRPPLSLHRNHNRKVKMYSHPTYHNKTKSPCKSSCFKNFKTSCRVTKNDRY